MRRNVFRGASDMVNNTHVTAERSAESSFDGVRAENIGLEERAKGLLRPNPGRLSLLIGTLLAFVISNSAPASAGVIINFAQSGSDVVATVSGSWNSTQPGLDMQLNPTGSGVVQAGTGFRTVFFEQGLVANSPSPGQYWDLVSNPANTDWGTGAPVLTYGSTSSANPAIVAFIMGPGFLRFSLAKSYVSGTAISGTTTWANKTLSDLNLTNAVTDLYTNVNSGETVTVNIVLSGGGSTVPEPSSMAICGLGALAMAYRARRKLKA